MKFPSDVLMSTLIWFELFLCAVSGLHENLDDDKSVKIDESNYVFFISEIFDKYGNNKYMTYEGFEHLLENLGLGKLEFDKKHDVSIHKINGTFIEFHDELSLHKHNHSYVQDNLNDTKETRKKRNLKLESNNLNPNIEKTLKRKCLTAQDILTTYGLQPYHTVLISPSTFLQICPAIVYELDQKLCQLEEPSNEIKRQEEEETYLVWIYASLSIFIMGAAGMLCVLMVPIIRKSYYTSLLQFLVSLAVGTLCGDALIHILPQVFNQIGKSESNLTIISKGTVTLLAIYFFFIVENVVKGIQIQKNKKENVKELGKMLPDNTYEVHGHNHGSSHGHSHGIKSVAWMAVMGDILHNITDGLSIGAAFSFSLSTGFASSIAIFCHELPHELGDYAILLASGMSVRKSLFYNFLSSVFSFFGMVAGVLLGEVEDASLWINAFTAGSFLYIALSDLIPEMQLIESKSTWKNFALQYLGLSLGGTLMFVVALYEDQIEFLLS